MRYLLALVLLPLMADAQTTIVLGPRFFTCVPGSQTWPTTTYPTFTTFTVPLGCSTIQIDLRGPGSGYGGGGDVNVECAGDGGGGGGGKLDGGTSQGGGSLGGYAGLSSSIRRGVTVLARAKIPKGGTGGAGAYWLGGTGGATDTDVFAGLTRTTIAGTSGSGSITKITGTLAVTPSESLVVEVGFGGGGGTGACSSAVSPPVLDGQPGQHGSLTISWP